MALMQVTASTLRHSLEVVTTDADTGEELKLQFLLLTI